MRRATLLLTVGLTGSTIALSLVAVGYEVEVLRLLGPLDSVRPGAVTANPDLVRSLVPLIGLTVARVLLLIALVVVATGAAEPMSAEAVASADSDSEPDAAGNAALTAPTRPLGAAAIVCWVFGLVLFVGGGTGQLVAFVANAEDNATFARQLRELAGSQRESAAAADELQARTDGVAEALNDYVASSEERVSARNELVAGFNSGVDERNTSGALDIATNELPAVIDRYQESVADLEEKEAALMIAVARLEEAP